ncbi:hypothetical protein BC833DRAFT_564835 [Globomyces pollinis-pini]|nr:hypothetical protein BC833DRAFT_564835 [Globomyces pollinis-pini]
MTVASYSPKLNQPSHQELSLKELNRRSTHSAIERKRRVKIQNQLQLLKKLVPSCAARDDNEKLLILQGTTDYIKQIQTLLMECQKTHPDMASRITKLLPDHVTKKPLILTLLPSYKPPAHITHVNSNMMANDFIESRIPSPPPSSIEIKPKLTAFPEMNASPRKQVNVMKLSHLLS